MTSADKKEISRQDINKGYIIDSITNKNNEKKTILFTTVDSVFPLKDTYNINCKHSLLRETACAIIIQC